MDQLTGRAHGRADDPRERTARWAALVVATAAAFGPLHVPYAVLIVVPVLIWSALRAPLREVLVQLTLVAAVAAGLTATDRGHAGLADYYAEKGESPGRWFGAGLGALDLEVGSQVTETHMRNLFGEGRHPDAERLENAALDAGKPARLVRAAVEWDREVGVRACRHRLALALFDALEHRSHLIRGTDGRAGEACAFGLDGGG